LYPGITAERRTFGPEPAHYKTTKRLKPEKSLKASNKKNVIASPPEAGVAIFGFRE